MRRSPTQITENFIIEPADSSQHVRSICTRVELKYLLMSARKVVVLEQPGWRTASSGGCSCMPSSNAWTSPFCDAKSAHFHLGMMLYSLLSTLLRHVSAS